MTDNRINLDDLLENNENDNHFVNKRKTEESLFQMEYSINQFYKGTAITNAEKLLRSMEKQTVQLRKTLLNILEENTATKELMEKKDEWCRELMHWESDLFGIRIDYENPVLNIYVPALMPHRVSKPDIIYKNTFGAYLNEYKNTHANEFADFRKKIQNGIIMMVELSYKNSYMVRDSDNIELKAIIDSFLHYGYFDSDDGRYMSLFITTNEHCTENNQTKISIIPKNHFVNYIQQTTATRYVDAGIELNSL